ncbi:subunit Sec5 of exocyst complex [Chloropicon primus]|nr:subunit Sec5 of exocyst complex [Chloropicon primus]
MESFRDSPVPLMSLEEEEEASSHTFAKVGNGSGNQPGGGGGGGFAARTRSSLIAELDLADLSDEDEEDEEALLESSLVARKEFKQVAWSAEDDEEVEEISLRILSSFQPSEIEGPTTSPAMAAERMTSIFSHGKAPANQDLLGLGTIDFRNASLVRHAAGRLDYERHGSIHKKPGIMGRTWSNSLGGKMMAPRLSSFSHGSSREDPSLLASSDSFDPKKYLGRVHRNSSQADLQKGQLYLTKQLNEGKDQRMLLVKENFERFIKCKNTIDDIHSKLQHNEFHSSSEAASTVLLMQSLNDVKDKSNTIFKPLIDRQHDREKLQRMLSTFRRYQWFLEMPTTLEEQLNNRKNDQVVSCYKKSKLFIEEHPNVDLFSKVFKEIERVVTGYKDKLYRNLESCKVDVERAKELITTLVRLQGNQILAQNLQKQNPFLVYLDSVSDYVLKKMKDHFLEYEKALQDLDSQEDPIVSSDEMSQFECIMLNVVMFARENRQRPTLKMFLEYSNVDCAELSFKLRLGKLQSTYVIRLSSVLLTVVDILLHLYLEDKSMLKTLRGRENVDRNYLSDIVEASKNKLHLIFRAYENQLHVLFASSEESNGLWNCAKEISMATSAVLEDVANRSMPEGDRNQILDVNMGLVERFVKYVCGQLEKVCTFTAHEAKMGEIRARRVHEEKSASLEILYVGDALLVGLQKVVETISQIQNSDDTGDKSERLVKFVERSLNNCLRCCAREFDRVGEEVMETSDYNSDIRMVLQGLQDAHFLENEIFPKACKIMSSITSLESMKEVTRMSPLVESMRNMKKRYVALNGVRTELLQRAYLSGSVEGRSENLFDVRNHVFIVLQFFVDQHSHGWQTVPHLCKELLTLLVESFFETLSEGFHENTERISKEEYLQSVLEISYLEKALGLYVSGKAHKSTEQIRRHLFSRCRTKVESAAMDKRVDAALESTKVHWLCFH